jgi:hypothetical protein
MIHRDQPSSIQRLAGRSPRTPSSET